ncbi:MAG: DNA double-strand break repair nuclease NurA [Candidatus Odinarchaeota archaeon]
MRTSSYVLLARRLFQDGPSFYLNGGQKVSNNIDGPCREIFNEGGSKELTSLEDIQKIMAEALNLVLNVEQRIPKSGFSVDKLNMKEFTISHDEHIVMTAVDGTSRFFWRYPPSWTYIGLTRAAAVDYIIQEAPNGHDELLKIDQCVTDDRIHVICTADTFAKTLSKTHMELFSLSGGNEGIILGDFMSLHELEHAVNIASKREKQLIVLDGALNVKNSPSFVEAMDKLLEICKNKDHVLVGISKESNIPVSSSSFIHEDYLHKVTKNLPGLHYFKAPDRPSTKFRQIGQVFYARLHERAIKWFRIDIAFPEDVEKILGHLADYARTNIIPGYPYPLVDAHELAVSLRQIPEIYERMFVEIASKMDFKPFSLLNGFTNMDGRHAGAFHELLDQIARKM